MRVYVRVLRMYAVIAVVQEQDCDNRYPAIVFSQDGNDVIHVIAEISEHLLGNIHVTPGITSLTTYRDDDVISLNMTWRNASRKAHHLSRFSTNV